MEAMRHYDLKLTMKPYTDVSQLPLVAGVEALPSFEVGNAMMAHSKKNSLKVVAC